MRCKSKSKNAFNILQNAKMVLVKICIFSLLPQQSSFQQNETALLCDLTGFNWLLGGSQRLACGILISSLLINFVGMNFVVLAN